MTRKTSGILTRPEPRAPEPPSPEPLSLGARRSVMPPTGRVSYVPPYANNILILGMLLRVSGLLVLVLLQAIVLTPAIFSCVRWSSS